MKIAVCGAAVILAVATVNVFGQTYQAGSVSPGEKNYEIAIQVKNWNDEKPMKQVAVAVAKQPAGLINFRVNPPLIETLEPGKIATFIVQFDVSEDFESSAEAEIGLSIMAEEAEFDQPNPIIVIHIAGSRGVSVCVLKDDAPKDLHAENAVDFCDPSRTPNEYDRIAVFFTPQRDTREPLEQRRPFITQIVGPNRNRHIPGPIFAPRVSEPVLAKEGSPGRMVQIVDLWNPLDKVDPAEARLGPGTYTVQTAAAAYGGEGTFGRGGLSAYKVGDWIDAGTFVIESARLHFQGFVTEEVNELPLPARHNLHDGRLTLTTKGETNRVTITADAWWKKAASSDQVNHTGSTLTFEFPEELAPGHETMGQIKAAIRPTFGDGNTRDDFFFTAGMHLMVPTDTKPPDRYLVEGSAVPVSWGNYERQDKICPLPSSCQWLWPPKEDSRRDLRFYNPEAVSREELIPLFAGHKDLLSGKPERTMPAHLHVSKTIWVIPVFITLADSEWRGNRRSLEVQSYGYAIYANRPGKYTGPRPEGGPETGQEPAGGETVASTGVGEGAEIDPGAAKAKPIDTPTSGGRVAKATPSKTGETTAPPSGGGKPIPPAPVVDIREVPNVVGLSAGEANKKLTAAGLVIKPLPGSPATSKDQSVTVESQYPSPRTKIEAGSIVEARIHSEFIDIREVPDVVGLSARDAREKIAAAGLLMKPKPGKPASTESDVGRVWTQSPKPGTAMEKGSPITVAVYGPVEESSPGQKFKTLVVPDVEGLTASQAKKRITDAGLKPAFRPGGTPSKQNQKDKVERQEPSPGTNTAPGAEVVMYVYGPYIAPTTPPAQGQQTRKDYCKCEVNTTLMSGNSKLCTLYRESRNETGAHDPYGRDIVHHIVNDDVVRNGNWKMPNGWNPGTYNRCDELLGRINCDRLCPKDERADNNLTAKTIVGYWSVTGEASNADTKVYGYMEFFQNGRFNLRITNKQQSGKVDQEEGKGTWELVGDQLTFGGDGGIRHKGNVKGDPSAFTMHDTAGWTLRFKKTSRTGSRLTYPDGPVRDDPIDSTGTFGR